MKSKQDPELVGMLRDLGRALSAALADSPEVGRTLRRIHQGGYRLHLMLDCVKAGDDPEMTVEPLPASATSTPEFRIHAKDLAFLRSIGIDPTRRLRRRRSD